MVSVQLCSVCIHLNPPVHPIIYLLSLTGVIFYLFHVDLNDKQAEINHMDDAIKNETINSMEQYTALAPGPPFVFGAFMVVIAILVAVFIPEEPSDPIRRPSGEKKKSSYQVLFSFSFLCFIYVCVCVVIVGNMSDV